MTERNEVAGRLQQAVPSGLVLLLAVWIAFVSFNVDDPGPYLFPRLVAIAMLALAAISFQRALRGKSRTGVGMDRRVLINLAPGVILMLVYVFFVAEYLGFYVGSFISFSLLCTIYDPHRYTDLRAWIRRLGISVGFIAVMYVLFALVLKVQTPRGIFI